MAQNAKKTFTEKVDLMALVANERANLAKQKEAELAAIEQSQRLERDLVFFNAARLGENDRFIVLAFPESEDTCKKPLELRYVARRLCALEAATYEKLATLVNAEGDLYRSGLRREFIAENRKSLQSLGWKEPPECGKIADEKTTAAPRASMRRSSSRTSRRGRSSWLTRRRRSSCWWRPSSTAAPSPSTTRT